MYFYPNFERNKKLKGNKKQRDKKQRTWHCFTADNVVLHKRARFTRKTR